MTKVDKTNHNSILLNIFTFSLFLSIYLSRRNVLISCFLFTIHSTDQLLTLHFPRKLHINCLVDVNSILLLTTFMAKCTVNCMGTPSTDDDADLKRNQQNSWARDYDHTLQIYSFSIIQFFIHLSLVSSSVMLTKISSAYSAENEIVMWAIVSWEQGCTWSVRLLS